MKFIFVIQQLLRTCQGHRLYGPLDGVKNTSKPVNFCFTLAHLSSCINHIISGFRLMLATTLLFGLTLNLNAQYTITGTVFSSTLNCATAPLNTCGGILYIGNGTDPAKLDINSNLDLTCLGPLQLIVQSNGTIDFSEKAWLKLASGSSVTIILTGTPGKLSASPCNSQQEFYIGTERYGCNNGHQDITFPEVVTNGGTGVVSSNSPVCVGSQIALFVSPPPTFKSPFSYSWSKSGTTFIPSSSVNNPTIENATPSNSGIYTVVINGLNSSGTPVTVTRTLDVKVSPAPTAANAGLDQIGASTCGLTTVTLAANAPTVGTGAWTILTGAGGTVTTPASPTSTFTGTTGTAYTLRWTISADCAVSTDDVNITINANNTINLNSAPGTNAQNICINTPITDITYAVGGSATGATVSVLPAGLTGVYNSGVFTISGTPTVSGTFNYTVTATGGCGTATATGSITVTPSVGTPVFLPSTSTRYQAIESISYTATSASVITYSLDLISTAAGNSIEPTTGLVNYSGTWSGTSIITASVTGCNGSRTATHSVRTNWCFALYAGAGAIHNDLLTTVTGDIGSNTGLIDGFGGGLAGTVNGTIHNNDATTLQAVTDLDDLFAVLDTKPINHYITTLDNTQIVEPGVYSLEAAAPLNGELILDGGSDPDAVFIIKIGGALSTQALSKVTLKNGTSVNNVYWIIKGAANIGENSVFRGTFIGTGAINLLTGSKLFGRALTKVGAITLTNCEVSSICAPYTCMSDNEPPTFTTPTLNPGYCVEDIYQAIYKDDAQGTSTDLTFVRPDYYTLLIADFNILDLISPADNCTLLTNPISWTINFADGRDNITSTGQFSTYVPIISPLTGIEFPLGTNHITYTVTDLAGNTTVKSIGLIVTPRPGFN